MVGGGRRVEMWQQQEAARYECSSSGSSGDSSKAAERNNKKKVQVGTPHAARCPPTLPDLACKANANPRSKAKVPVPCRGEAPRESVPSFIDGRSKRLLLYSYSNYSNNSTVAAPALALISSESSLLAPTVQ